MRLTEDEYANLMRQEVSRNLRQLEKMRKEDAKKNKNNSAVSPADVEPNIINAAKGKDAAKKVNQRCRLSVHHKRKRLADPDGISLKAAIDSLVLVGIIKGDSAEFISEITQSQEKVAGQEETVIDIVWEDGGILRG